MTFTWRHRNRHISSNTSLTSTPHFDGSHIKDGTGDRQTVSMLLVIMDWIFLSRLIGKCSSSRRRDDMTLQRHFITSVIYFNIQTKDVVTFYWMCSEVEWKRLLRWQDGGIKLCSLGTLWFNNGGQTITKMGHAFWTSYFIIINFFCLFYFVKQKVKKKKKSEQERDV